MSIIVAVFAGVLISYARDLQENNSLEQAILNDLNVVVVALILAICAGLIFIVAVAGIVGAWKEWRKCLVFVCVVHYITDGAVCLVLSTDLTADRSGRVVSCRVVWLYVMWCVVRRVQYASMMFIILCIQLAMGAYLNQLDPASITERWHRAAPATRDAIQKFLTCCGWERVTDTAPFPDCVYPAEEFGTELVANCQYKAEQYIKEHIKPVALAAMTIAALEVRAVERP